MSTSVRYRWFVRLCLPAFVQHKTSAQTTDIAQNQKRPVSTQVRAISEVARAMSVGVWFNLALRELIAPHGAGTSMPWYLIAALHSALAVVVAHVVRTILVP